MLSLIATEPRISLRARVRFAALLNESENPGFAAARDALEIDDRLMRELLSWRSVPELRQRASELAPRVVTIVDSAFPARLRQLAAPPLALHSRGAATILDRPAVAVVGSRRASSYGMNVARRLTGQLARAGLVIVSGFARGIDAVAHTTAIDEGGATVAVLGTGLDIAYPSGHVDLRSRVSDHGVLISEFPDGTPPRPANFPIRNRIIAGLVRGVVVIEAGLRSGSLVTARLALENNREVWAVPGSILSDSSAGCHALIQQGARLITGAGEVLEDLEMAPPMPMGDPLRHPEGLTPDGAALWQQLSPDNAVHVDLVAHRLGWEPPRLAGALLDLELAGILLREPGGGVLRYVR